MEPFAFGTCDPVLTPIFSDPDRCLVTIDDLGLFTRQFWVPVRAEVETFSHLGPIEGWLVCRGSTEVTQASEGIVNTGPRGYNPKLIRDLRPGFLALEAVLSYITYKATFVTRIELVRAPCTLFFGGEEVFGVDVLLVGFVDTLPGVGNCLGVAGYRMSNLGVILISIFDCKEDLPFLDRSKLCVSIFSHHFGDV